MAINPGYALQFKRTLDRASEPKRARATGTVTAVSSDSDGKIRSATVSTGSGLLSVPVPYGTNVYTGMTVAITNDGTPSNAQWRLSGTTSVPGGIQGGSIINHDGNTFAMFDSIWVRNDGVIIVGGDVDLDGDPTGPRVESNQCGYFGYDQYDRQSLAIYAANCDGYYAGDVFLGPEEMSRISVLPTEGVIRVVNEGRTSLEFSPDGNFIRDPLTIGNPVGARINIGDIEDKATFVMRDKHGVAKLVARTGDTSGVYFHVGNPPPEDNSMWFDSATGRLNVNGHVTMQSMDVRGRATFASTGEFMIVDPSDPGRFGVITPKGQYAYTTDALGVVHLIRVDAWGPLTLESEYGSGIWRTWVGGTQIFGDPRYRHFRIERGATARAGLFNGETPVAYMDQAGKGYFTGEVTMESGVVNGDVVFGGGAGALGPNGLSIVSDGDATPETTNAVAWYDEASFTNRTGWIYGQTGITAHNLTIETDGRVLDYTATTYLYARGGASKTGAVRMYAYGNDTDSNGGNIGIAATGAAGGATATVNADAVQITGNGYWKPASDSTTALQLQQAGGTPVLTIDTTNSRVFSAGSFQVLGGTTASSTAKIYAYTATSANVAGNAVGRFENSVSGASAAITQIQYGAIGGIHASTAGANAISDVRGLQGEAVVTNASATVLSATGLRGDATVTAGTVYGAAAINATLGIYGGTVYDAYGLYVSAVTGAVANYAIYTNAGRVHFGDSVGICTTSPDSQLHVHLDDAATNAASQLLTLSHNTSGTAAAGFGSSVLWELKSSTTADQSAARVQALWYEATHASRKADLVLTAFDTAEREGLRIRGAGSAPAIGFLGATPAARRSHVADPSGGSTIDAEARTAINSILATLETFGLHATS